MHELYVENDFKLLWDEYGAKIVLKQFNHSTKLWEEIEEEYCMNLLSKLKARAELEATLLKETYDSKTN